MQACDGTYKALSTGQTVAVGSTAVELIDTQPPLLQLHIQNQTWLLLGNLKLDEQKNLVTKHLPHVQVVWWSGESLASDLLEALKPEVAITSSATLDPKVASQLRKTKTQVFWTGRDGAIEWTPSGKFEATIEATENNANLL